MIALPSAPAPAPRRQVFVGTAVACAAGTWVPKGVNIPLVPANIMLIAFIPICVFAQWAVYSAKRGDSPHTGLALGLTGLMGIAFINAQAYIYSQMNMPANGGTFNAMFYAFTGVMTALAIIGVVFSAVTAFRFLGGRTTDREIVSAHAMYWYFLSFVFTMLWFVLYVTK